MEKRKKNHILLAAAALLLAVLLLAATGFSGVRVLTGPKSVTDGGELAEGDYIRADLTYILDVIGEEKRPDGTAAAYYAVAPIGNKFTVIRFPASDSEGMMSLRTDTKDFLQGRDPDMGFHMRVTGTAADIDEATAQLLADWFNDNAEWMSRAGVITAVDNYGDYLNSEMILSGRVGGVSWGASMTVTILAAALLVYAVAELYLLGTGRYDGKGKRHG